MRPLGNVVYFMPPYVITPDEIDALVDAARKASRPPLRLTRVFVEPPLVPARSVRLPERPRNHWPRAARWRRCGDRGRSTAAAASTAARSLAVDGKKWCAWDARRRGSANRRLRSRWCRASRAANAWTGRCRRPPNSACAPSCPCSPRAVSCASTTPGRAPEAAPLAGGGGERVRTKRAQRRAPGARPARPWTFPGGISA